MADEVCDYLGSRWFECCWRKRCPDCLVCLAEVVGTFINIMPLGIAVEIMVIVAHYLPVENNEIIASIFEYIHHILMVPLCTILGLYLVFKQRRPCLIVSEASNGKTIGPIYGMPSGDALTASAFATAFWPYNRVVSVILFISVIASRVIRGYHTIIQVSAGALFGFIYYLIILYFSPINYLVNWAVGMVLPNLVLFDPALKVQPKFNYYNFCSWLISNGAYLMFDIVACSPEEYRLFPSNDKGVESIFSFVVATILRIVQVIGAEDGWVFSLV